MERLSAIENAINALIGPESLRREFFGHVKLVGTLYRAVKPDPAAIEFSGRMASIATLAIVIRAKLSPNPPDIATILKLIGGLLDDFITGIQVPRSFATSLLRPSK
jgi:type I restriction enzyme R subunit